MHEAIADHNCISTAIGGYDFTGIPSTLEVFPPGSMDGEELCVGITLLDDGALEENQTFTVLLTTLDPDVMIEDDVATVTITDNDGKLNPNSIWSILSKHTAAGYTLLFNIATYTHIAV